MGGRRKALPTLSGGPEQPRFSLAQLETLLPPLSHDKGHSPDLLVTPTTASTQAMASQSVRALRPRSLLLSFILRESPSSSPAAGSSIPTAFDPSHNPFAPTKSPNSNSHTAPKYSLRRQKVLRRELESNSWPADVLPPTPVRAKEARKTTLYRANHHIPVTKVLDELSMEKKGPYVGRKGAAFKGKMWERKMGARQEELKVALEATGAKEVAWRKVSCGRVAHVGGPSC